LYFLLTLGKEDKEKILFYDSDKPIKCIDAINEWLELVLFHFGKRPELRFFWAWQGLMYRMHKRLIILMKPAREAILARTKLEFFILPEEETAWMGPSPARSLINIIEGAVLRSTGVAIEKYFDKNNRSFKRELAKQDFVQLKKTWDELEKSTADEYQKLKSELGADWAELMVYDTINHYFDRLSSAVFDIILKFPEALTYLTDKQKERIKIIDRLGVANFSDEIVAALGNRPAPKSSNIDFNKLDIYFDPFSNPYDHKYDTLGQNSGDI
jgi:hypothetical protein